MNTNINKIKYIRFREGAEISNKIPFEVTSDNVTMPDGSILSTNISNEVSARQNADENLQSQINGLASGSPLVASSTSEMTDTTKVYVNTTDGKWYYYNGSAWTIGGVYQSTGIGDNSIDKLKLTAQVKEEYDNINFAIYSFPDEVKKEVNYIAKFSNENVDNAGTFIPNTSNRLRTNFIPVGCGIKFARPTGSIYGCWCRGFDKDYNYISSYMFTISEATKSNSYSTSTVNVDYLVKVNPNVKFVILVFNVANNLSQDLSSIDWVPTMNIIDFKKLDTIFEYKNNYNLPIEMEFGGIRTATGIDNPNYITSAVRSKFYYEINNKVITKSISGCYVLEYDKDFTFIKYSNTSSLTLTLDNNTKYLRFEILSGDLTEPLYVVGIGKKIKRNYTINENMIDCQRLYFKIAGTDYYSSCLFKLPSNYNPIGNKIPMIVFVHGSGDYLNINSTAMTSYYNDLYNYLRDNGYAIFDCYGWGSYIQTDSCSTYGTPYNNNVYSSGIEYFTDLFNIDTNKIYMVCKSLGGIQALAMLYQNRIKLNAIGFFAPALSALHHGFGYNQTERNAIAHFLGMTTPPNSALTNPPTQEYETYLNDNLDILISYDPYWKGLLVDKDTKLHNTIYTKDNTINEYQNKFKVCQNIPTKFWYALDDVNIPPNAVTNLINTLKNFGSNSSSTIFPNGTGGHHCVDTDENAPQTTNVTTALGIYYASVPTAYYEFIQFISQL